jgi:hypothetical protein
VTQTQSSRDYRLFKIRRVTKQADVQDFVLCVIVAVIFSVLKSFAFTTCYSCSNLESVITGCSYD